VCVWLAQAADAKAKFLLHTIRSVLHFGACPKAPDSAVIRGLASVSRGGVAMSARASAANLHTRIDARLLDIVRREAGQRNVSVRAVVEAAVRERYDPVAAQRQDAALLSEVRALRREVGQVNFANRVMVELTTLTTRNLFQRLPSPTEESRAAGNGFYNALIASVEKVLVQDRPLLDKLAASLIDSVADFDMVEDAGDDRPDLDP